ncbi:MFS transporter [Trichloromonas sp.]|uniref:MFS transporter n=1 Tax=Trichloromonas sp. TaxID=3069249 RepID=UPI003D815E77
MNLSGNIRKLYAFSFLKMTLFPMAVITLFWKDQIGLSLTEILLLQGLFSLATLLMEYPSGYLSDRLGYRFSLSLASLIGIAGWALYTVAGTFGEVLLAEILLGFSFAFISGSDSALLYESLRQSGQEEDYARYDGRMSGYAQIGEAAGAVFAGLMYATAPLLPFFVQIGVWLLALIVSRSLVEVPAEPSPAPQSHLVEAWAIGRHALVESPHLRYTILLTTLLGLASFFPVWLIQPTMQQDGVPLAWFGPIWAVANLTVALFSLLSQRAFFHLGERGMVMLFLVLVTAGYAGLGLVSAWWGFVFYFLLTAMRGLQGPRMRQHLQAASKRSNRASILSLKSLVFRLLFVCSGPLVGWSADTLGLHRTFLLLASVFFLCLPLLAWRFLHTLPPAKNE